MDRILSQFENAAPLASSPSGAAWTAREPDSGRQVLIKRIPGYDEKTRATQALTLRHPGIVPARRWMRDGDKFYVVRDWISGQNLRQALSHQDQRAFDRLHARLIPLLDALDFAHTAGIAHGAVTPENVLTSVQYPNDALLSDFAAARRPQEPPTPRRDFYDLCDLYKEFLPSQTEDDESGSAARFRLLRNLTDTQQTAESAEELRDKLDAVARMADLLGFSAEGLQNSRRPRRGARLVCAISPSPATLAPGGGTMLTLGLDNEGDAPLHIESISSDVVWLNLPSRFVPVELKGGEGGDLIWTLSGARLEPGSYSATLTVLSNDGLLTPTPARGTDWPIQTVAVPVEVRGALLEEAEAVPLVESLGDKPPRNFGEPASKATAQGGDHAGIACVQEPDPGLVRYGQSGVLHLGIRNLGSTRLRLNNMTVRPAWLTYPGGFHAFWIAPGETQYLGLTIAGKGLAGGDYTAEVTFTTSVIGEAIVGPKPVWRDMTCEVRIRVVRGSVDALPGGVTKTGCIPLLLAAASSAGLLAWAAKRFL